MPAARTHSKTKTICPYTSHEFNKELLNEIMLKKINAIRFNLQTTPEQELNKIVDFILSNKYPSYTPSLMLDLYPSARARVILNQPPEEVKFGQLITLSNYESKNSIVFSSFNAESLFLEMAQVFLGYGEIEMKIEQLEISNGKVKALCKVEQGGVITGGMALHVPQSRPVYNENDLGIGKSLNEIVQFTKNRFQFLILPSYLSTQNIEDLKSSFFAAGYPAPWLIQKIDNEESLERIDDFIESVEGFLVSRRELSLSMNPANLPMRTKEIFQYCSENAKIVFTASEILGSMRFKNTPTRAEVSDLANAVIDGTDGVVLSEDITISENKLKALQVMQNVIKDIESDTQTNPNWHQLTPTIHNEMDAVSIGALRTARRVGAKAIVCITHSGNTAFKLASFKGRIPIIAVTFNPDVAQKLKMIRGVESIYIPTPPKIDAVLGMISDQLKKDEWLQKGDNYVFVSVTLSSIDQNHSNLFSVQNMSE